ncbi:MAG: EAL domain-containing protein [Candidatus Eremiobacteraeota bacterium]|nr:EAL domain-containing protein [Candidatus Eremiobacteraeota bacterium]
MAPHIRTYERSRNVAPYIVAIVLAVAIPLLFAAGLLLGRQANDIAVTERKSVGLDDALRAGTVVLRLRTLRAGAVLHGHVDLRDRLSVQGALTRLYDYNAGPGRVLGLEKRLRRLEAFWSQIPERGDPLASVNATLTAALDLERTIDERSQLRSDTDTLSTDLVDAAELQLPIVEDRADQARNLILSASKSYRDLAAVALGVDIFSAQTNRAYGNAVNDLERASALDPHSARALGALERAGVAWHRLGSLAASMSHDTAPGSRDLRPLLDSADAFFGSVDVATQATTESTRRALEARLRGERTTLLGLQAGTVGAVAIVMLLGLLLARAVRDRDRRDLQRARDEAERLRVEAEHRRTRELLALTEARFEAVFERASMGVAIVDMAGRIVRTNAALDAVLPAASGAELGTTQPEFERLRTGQIDAYTVEFATRLSGAARWTEAVVSLVRDESEQPMFAVSMVKDVTDRHELADRLRWEATHDPLVDLPNRAALFEHMRGSFIGEGSIKAVAGVAFVDLDGFEEINDTLGHPEGDRVLKLAARRLAAATDHGDFVARFGGDEFVIVLERRSGRDELVNVVRRVIDSLSAPFRIDDREVYVKPSAGIVVVETPYDRVEDIVLDAQTATVAAKTAERHRFVVFDASMRERARRLMMLGSQLRRALEREQLHLAFQPIVTLTSQRVASFEVLLRWEHPELGLVSPAEFVPIAEDAGLIVPIGRWVFERACAQLARWHADGGTLGALRLSVNAAVQEIVQSDYCDFIERTIARHGLAPGDITLEITESAILRSDRASSETLDRLRRAGLRLAIDDFGTGYSSLRYLQAFPFDYLKIDGSFVRGKGPELASEPIIAMIVALGKSIGVSVIAEGVETERQAAALERLGCASGQGFLFGRPAPASLVPDFVQGRLKVATR